MKIYDFLIKILIFQLRPGPAQGTNAANAPPHRAETHQRTTQLLHQRPRSNQKSALSVGTFFLKNLKYKAWYLNFLWPYFMFF